MKQIFSHSFSEHSLLSLAVNEENKIELKYADSQNDISLAVAAGPKKLLDGLKSKYAGSKIVVGIIAAAEGFLGLSSREAPGEQAVEQAQQMSFNI